MEDCDVEVSTDASDFGWGIHHDGALHQGCWEDCADTPLHINAKEFTFLRIFLEEFLPESPVPRLLWRTHSTTAIAYVVNQGGTLSHPLLDLA